MPSNADYTREYFQIIDELDGDIESRRAAFNYMQDSTAIVHHQVVASSFVPRLFNRKTYEVMKRTAETSHRILCKVLCNAYQLRGCRRELSARNKAMPVSGVMHKLKNNGGAYAV